MNHYFIYRFKTSEPSWTLQQKQYQKTNSEEVWTVTPRKMSYVVEFFAAYRALLLKFLKKKSYSFLNCNISM